MKEKGRNLTRTTTTTTLVICEENMIRLQSRTSSIDATASKSRSIVDDYLIDERAVLRGASRRVLGAIRKADGMSVVLKSIPKSRVRVVHVDGHMVPLEAFLMKQLEAMEGVVHLLDIIDLESRYVLIIEKPKGYSDLFSYISCNGPLNEQDAKKVFLKVAQTSAVMMFDHGVVHCDIKDENILINAKSLDTKLIDFGSALPITAKLEPPATMSQATSCSTHGVAHRMDDTDSCCPGDDEQCEMDLGLYFHGTDVYCPPEWILHQYYYPEPALVWSLGVLLFDLTSGDIPFHSESAVVRPSRVQLPTHMSDDLKNLIESCLLPDINCRIRLNQLLKHRWLATNGA